MSTVAIGWPTWRCQLINGNTVGSSDELRGIVILVLDVDGHGQVVGVLGVKERYQTLPCNIEKRLHICRSKATKFCF